LKLPVIGTLAKGDALRIGTYNVQFLTGFASSAENAGSPCQIPGDDDRHRPPVIAERVIASRYTIAFNEMFDDDAQEAMVNSLQATYPYYLKKIRQGDLEDSGLEIFSKYPFEPLPVPTYGQHDVLFNGQAFPYFVCEGSDCDKVAFIEFHGH